MSCILYFYLKRSSLENTLDPWTRSAPPMFCGTYSILHNTTVDYHHHNTQLHHQDDHDDMIQVKRFWIMVTASLEGLESVTFSPNIGKKIKANFLFFEGQLEVALPLTNLSQSKTNELSYYDGHTDMVPIQVNGD